VYIATQWGEVLWGRHRRCGKTHQTFPCCSEARHAKNLES